MQVSKTTRCSRVSARNEASFPSRIPEAETNGPTVTDASSQSRQTPGVQSRPPASNEMPDRFAVNRSTNHSNCNGLAACMKRFGQRPGECNEQEWLALPSCLLPHYRVWCPGVFQLQWRQQPNAQRGRSGIAPRWSGERWRSRRRRHCSARRSDVLEWRKNHGWFAVYGGGYDR